MYSIATEKVFFHLILQNLEYTENADPSFFTEEIMKTIFRVAKTFRIKYKAPPSKKQLMEVLNFAKMEYEEDYIDALYKINLNDYSKEWVKDNVECFIKINTLHRSFVDGLTYIKTTNIDSSNVDSIIQKTTSGVNKVLQKGIGFTEGFSFFNPEGHIQKDEDKISSGYEFIDNANGGGFDKKSLNVFAAPQKTGKSIWLCNFACNAIKQGLNTCYLTMEMKEPKIIKRIGSNLFDVDVNQYKQFSENSDRVKENIDKLYYDIILHNKNSIAPRLDIKGYPTSTASVLDVEEYVKRMELIHNIKYSIVIIDYINIMKDYRNPNSENLYMKVKTIAEDVRAMADRNDWVVLTATQLKRNSFGSSDITLNDISESMGLASTVDSMFAIEQDPLLKSRNKYNLKALLIRDGEGQFWKQSFDVIYKYMKITQDSSPFTVTI